MPPVAGDRLSPGESPAAPGRPLLRRGRGRRSAGGGRHVHPHPRRSRTAIQAGSRSRASGASCSTSTPRRRSGPSPSGRRLRDPLPTLSGCIRSRRWPAGPGLASRRLLRTAPFESWRLRPPTDCLPLRRPTRIPEPGRDDGQERNLSGNRRRRQQRPRGQPPVQRAGQGHLPCVAGPEPIGPASRFTADRPRRRSPPRRS